MNKLVNFFQTAGLYFIGNVMSKIISFFLLPLYTSQLNPSTLGEFDYVVTLMNFFSPICFFQIWDAMFRFSFDYTDNENKERVINTSFFICVLGIMFYSMVFVVINGLNNFKLVPMVFLYGILVSLNYQYTYLARVFRRNALFSISGFINCLVVAVVNIFLIIYMKCGLESLYISSILGMVVQCIIIEWKLKTVRCISFRRIDKTLAVKMIKFSLPLCVATVSYWLLSGLTKVIIVNFLGNHENGLYTVTNKFAMFINMAVSIFQYAWNETAYMANKDVSRGELYNVVIKYLIQFVFAAACGLMILSKLLFPFFAVGAEYQDALKYLSVTIVGVAFNSIAGFLGTIFSTEKETKSIFFTTAAAAMLNCVAGPLFTKYVGLQGALMALAISFGVLMIGRLIILKRRWKVEIGWKSLFALMILFLTSILVYVFRGVIELCMFCAVVCILFLLLNKEVFYIIKKMLREARRE